MATVRQLLDPSGKRLIRLAVAPLDSGRLIALGDLNDLIKIPVWTTVMRIHVANTPLIHRQRFIHVVTLREWVRQLAGRDHKKSAGELERFIDWIVTVDL